MEPLPDASAEGPPPPAPRPARLTRRRLLGVAAGGAAAGLAWPLWRIAPPPPLDSLQLSGEAAALVQQAWAGLDPSRVIDVHTHVIGLGTGGTGCAVHPDADSWWHPIRKLKTRIYKGAGGIWDDSRADALYVERLRDLLGHQVLGRTVLLAFDRYHGPDGRADLSRSELYVPNDYVIGLAARWPERLLFGASVHPWRPDALDELERCAAAGAVLVKWLPNAMGIDPLDPRCDAFFQTLARHGLPLLCHVGEEQAVHAEEAQELGNPLRLRRALDHGVTVIAAHCGSLGSARDLDVAPDGAGERPRVPCYELWRRMVGEGRGRLFGDISATTQFNRCREVLPDLLARPALHAHLVNGSDYPLPAIDPLIRTGLLVDLGLLDPAERPLLNELCAYNPLTFDFVLKRRLRRIGPDGEEQRLAPEVFESARALEPRLSRLRAG